MRDHRIKTPAATRRAARPALVAAMAGLALAAIFTGYGPAAAGADDTVAAIDMQCRGTTPEGDTALRGLVVLSALRLRVTRSTPAEVPVGQAATASFSWAYDIDATTAAGARALGIDSVTISGLRLAVAVTGPASSTTAATPTADHTVSLAGPGTVDLGTASTTIDTTAGGAVTYVAQPVDLRVGVPSKGLAIEASCRPAPSGALTPTFVIDPAAPVISPRMVDQSMGDASSLTVDLRSQVSAGPTPIDAASWSITQTPWGGTATISAGVLRFTPPAVGAWSSVVYQVCSAAPAATTTTTTVAPTSSTTTTTSTTTTSTLPPAELATDAAVPADTVPATTPTTASTTTGASVPAGTTPTTAAPTAAHCAQGVVNVSSARVLAAEVSGTTAARTGPTAAAPIKLTG